MTSFLVAAVNILDAVDTLSTIPRTLDTATTRIGITGMTLTSDGVVHRANAAERNSINQDIHTGARPSSRSKGTTEGVIASLPQFIEKR